MRKSLSGFRDRVSRAAATCVGCRLLALAVFAASVEMVGLAVVRARGHDSQERLKYYLHGFVETIEGAPPLARWDSIWFYAVATEGYTGQGRDSWLTPAFLPLYPLLMRAVGDVAGCGYFTAGIWVSRLALLAVIVLLPNYVREREGPAMPGWVAVVTLLAFPSAYILLAVYSEALFLALALAVFVLARRGRHGWAALAAFAAALTRIHGLALVPALAVLGWEQRRLGPRAKWIAAVGDAQAHGAKDAERGPEACLEAAMYIEGNGGGETFDSDAPLRRAWQRIQRSMNLASARTFLPAMGAAAGYVALGAYFWVALGNPLAHLAAKYDGWRQKFTAPWTTYGAAIGHFAQSLAHPGLGTTYTSLELPCFYLIVAAVAMLCARRWWPEAAYVASAGAMSLCCGTLDGVPRYTIVLFPVFAVLSDLRRWPVLWGLYLVASVLLQACLLVNFVRFGNPPP